MIFYRTEISTEIEDNSGSLRCMHGVNYCRWCLVLITLAVHQISQLDVVKRKFSSLTDHILLKMITCSNSSLVVIHRKILEEETIEETIKK